jgi:hypothetical protein
VSQDLRQLFEIPDPVRSREAAPPAMATPATPSRTRNQRRTLGITLTLAAVFWVLVVLFFEGTRADLEAPAILAQLAIWTVTGAIALAVALRPSARGLPPKVRVLQAALVGAVLTFAVVAVALAPSSPMDWWGSRACVGLSSLMSLGPLGLAALALRRSLAGAATWQGAAIGAVSGLAGTIGVHAHCPVQASMHVLLAHGFPIALGAAVGALLGKSELRA